MQYGGIFYQHTSISGLPASSSNRLRFFPLGGLGGSFLGGMFIV
jgi:hypothetical protein